MLNNSDHTSLPPTEEDPKSTELFELSMRSPINRLESSSNECGSVPAVSEEDPDEERKQINVAAAVSSEKKKKLIIKVPTVLGEFKTSVDMNEDDEGFRTPTSSDKKIPVMISPKCPPPPRKPKSISISSSTTNKRKTPSSSPSKMNLHCRCRYRIRISDEDIKALFPPAFLADLGRKIKKARTDHVN